MECSDPRDRLFSILSLIEDGEHDIPPDYNQTAVQAYTALAMFLLRRGRVDIMLGNANRFLPADEISANLPSWVPDLRERFRGGYGK